MKAKVKATGKIITVDPVPAVSVDRKGFLSHEWRGEDENGESAWYRDEDLDFTSPAL